MQVVEGGVGGERADHLGALSGSGRWRAPGTAARVRRSPGRWIRRGVGLGRVQPPAAVGEGLDRSSNSSSATAVRTRRLQAQHGLGTDAPARRGSGRSRRCRAQGPDRRWRSPAGGAARRRPSAAAPWSAPRGRRWPDRRWRPSTSRSARAADGGVGPARGHRAPAEPVQPSARGPATRVVPRNDQDSRLNATPSFALKPLAPFDREPAPRMGGNRQRSSEYTAARRVAQRRQVAGRWRNGHGSGPGRASGRGDRRVRRAGRPFRPGAGRTRARRWR